MTKIRIIVDAPGYGEGTFENVGDFIGIGEDAARQIRNQTPALQSASLDGVIIGDDLSEMYTVNEVSTAVVAGDAAGPIAVTGISLTDELISVVRHAQTNQVVAGAAAGNVTVNDIEPEYFLTGVYLLTEADPPTVDNLTAEFTITASDTINNTGGTSSAGEALLVLYTSPDDITAGSEITDDDEITTDVDTSGEVLVVSWADIEAT